jgi:hydroxylamine dehydrogenase
VKAFLSELSALFMATSFAVASEPSLGRQTESCVSCHELVTPGIVSDWTSSRHARVTVNEAVKVPALERRVSIEESLGEEGDIAIGCAECHTRFPDRHGDTFEHNGFKVHILVTPDDCATCHPVERSQYDKNLMSNAHGNLNDNPVYRALVDEVNGLKALEKNRLVGKKPDARTDAESCFYCHGTEVKVEGEVTKKTDLGEMLFPVLSGWPNDGVGRLNPDGSKGSCASCHTRHTFSIEMARKPHTCSECHKGPDVPAYSVYTVSKHGNIYSSHGGDWDFSSVPWVTGRDFGAPTCATCHDRSGWRIFGLVYAHPSPVSANTATIRNKAGLPLPTELTGEPALDFLVDVEEQESRKTRMKRICLSCHSSGWVEEHYARLENTIDATNEMTLTATRILLRAWETGAASGLPQGESIFDESIEKKWIEQWLFFANSTRFSSAMAGADYGAFAKGRWFMTRNLEEMNDWVESKLK